MGKLLPVLLLVLGIAGGVGAGLMLAPEPVTCPEPGDAEAGDLPEGCPPPPDPDATEEETGEENGEDLAEFVRMNDQFVVPVLRDGEARALVVLSLTLEVEPGSTAAIFEIEPKLRDALLRVLFDHANAGGFDGAYTAAGPMVRLRRALLEAAVKIGGDDIRDVLVLDLLRQET